MKREDALEYHSSGRPGKIAVVPTKPLNNQRDLALAYSPGVAEPCLEIEANPDDAYKYTAKGNLVAVVTNGTAVLGLGNIGALAGKPVMEGKANLFKQFADLDVFDLEVGSENPDDVIRFCQLLEPTVGGINLEDIRAPDCFYIEETLRKTMKIPVFHDDQHGTAIISGAALLNALEIVGKDIDEDPRASSPAPAPPRSRPPSTTCGSECTRENILLTDRQGVDLRGPAGRDGSVQGAVRERDQGAHASPRRSSAPTCSSDFRSPAPSPARWSRRWRRTRSSSRSPIRSRRSCPTRCARSAPTRSSPPAAATIPNQVNNVLGFPFIFRGALDARATQVNEEMKMAATRALAALAKEDVPESVSRLYGLRSVKFGPDYLIPFPFDPRVLLWVAPAVAWAAVASGVAKEFIDLEEYREQLEARLGRARGVMRGIINRAVRDPQARRVSRRRRAEDHSRRAHDRRRRNRDPDSARQPRGDHAHRATRTRISLARHLHRRSGDVAASASSTPTISGSAASAKD